MTRRGTAVQWLVIAVVLLGTFSIAPVRAAYPTLPPGIYSQFLSGLAVPVVAPSASATLTGTLSDPGPLNAISAANLTLEIYAFNAYPGNATQALSGGPAPSFADSLGPPTVLVLPFANLAAHTSTSLSESIVVPSGAAAGAYAVRTQLSFVENGTPYLLQSRGYFSYDSWTNATAGPNGTTILNVSRLGVSGVLPETAVLVVNNPYPWTLTVLIVGAIACAAAGGYFASRKGPGSSSGARSGGPETSAPSARGKSRKSDGD
ncbi:MAG: hypothetical protein L3K17_06060 [Thermoplasmata archaeon]|nr:hypothetical protein [Thermoplasmata archaeon]